jgi:hypothetical protein
VYFTTSTTAQIPYQHKKMPTMSEELNDAIARNIKLSFECTRLHDKITVLTDTITENGSDIMLLNEIIGEKYAEIVMLNTMYTDLIDRVPALLEAVRVKTEKECDNRLRDRIVDVEKREQMLRENKVLFVDGLYRSIDDIREMYDAVCYTAQQFFGSDGFIAKLLQSYLAHAR